MHSMVIQLHPSKPTMEISPSQREALNIANMKGPFLLIPLTEAVA